MEWCRLMHLVPPETLTEACIKMEEHIEGGNQWAKVVGPMSAAYIHLKEIHTGMDLDALGGKIYDQEKQGDQFEVVDGVSWHKDRIEELWPKISRHRGGLGLQVGADFTAGQKHYRWLVKKGRMREAWALMFTLTGALWSLQRLVEEGIVREDAPEACCPLMWEGRSR